MIYSKNIIDLFDRIEVGSRTEFEGKQLSCATELVFNSGVKANEIPGLRVGDVVALLAAGGEFRHPLSIVGGRSHTDDGWDLALLGGGVLLAFVIICSCIHSREDHHHIVFVGELVGDDRYGMVGSVL